MNQLFPTTLNFIIFMYREIRAIVFYRYVDFVINRCNGELVCMYTYEATCLTSNYLCLYFLTKHMKYLQSNNADHLNTVFF